jgi:hypothetical protein
VNLGDEKAYVAMVVSGQSAVMLKDVVKIQTLKSQPLC